MTMWAVRLEDVTKRYRMGGVQVDSLGRVLSGTPRRVLDRVRGHRQPGRREGRGKLALEHIDLEIEEGASYALIGSNGAGKSTALRLISRISPPSSGRVRVRGRVGALMEVSSGVHFELTGRENIWLYGSILGISRAEIRRRFDEIVEFAGLSESLETQVKYYSSGMQLRLGFSIASHLEPDVFVVDEALAVGDTAFQAKCVERMTRLSRQGTTLLFVSHQLPTVEALCTHGALLSGGRLVEQGEVRPVLAHYLRMLEVEQERGFQAVETDDPVRIVGVSCHAASGEERQQFGTNESIEIRFRLEGEAPMDRPHVTVGISDGRPGMLVQCSMLDDGDAPARVNEHWECRLTIPHLPLRPRLYWIWAGVYGADAVGMVADWAQVGHFRVVGDVGSGPRGLVSGAYAGALALPYEWDVRT